MWPWDLSVSDPLWRSCPFNQQGSIHELFNEHQSRAATRRRGDQHSTRREAAVGKTRCKPVAMGLARMAGGEKSQENWGRVSVGHSPQIGMYTKEIGAYPGDQARGGEGVDSGVTPRPGARPKIGGVRATASRHLAAGSHAGWQCCWPLIPRFDSPGEDLRGIALQGRTTAKRSRPGPETPYQKAKRRRPSQRPETPDVCGASFHLPLLLSHRRNHHDDRAFSAFVSPATV